jgi:rubrerythrin
MASLKGSKTEQNLKAAFAGESQARGKYHYFATKAKEEGFGKAAQIFDETAVNEQEHAKIWLKLLEGIGSTEANLRAAADGEHFETTDMYVGFAKTAREEGFGDIADKFDQVAKIESAHEARYLKLLEEVKQGGGQGGGNPSWKCDNCGNVIAAKNAPSTCPVCGQSDIPWSGYKAYVKVEG